MLNTKRLIALLLALVLALPVGALTARAAAPMTITVSAAEADPGDTVSLTVDLTGNTGFAGFTLRAVYDADVMTLTGITQGTLLNEVDASGLIVNTAKGIANWATTTNTTGDGHLMTLTFTVHEDAAGGTYAVGLELEDIFSVNASGAFLDCAASVAAGSVTVVSQEHVHDYTAVETAPTCTERGYTTYTCDCGDSYKGDYLEPLGHVYVGGKCARCGATTAQEVASGWSGATQWTLTDDGVLTVYGAGKMKNYGYAGGQPWLNKGVDITAVVIKEGVTSVGSGAFRNLTTLKSVTFPVKSLTAMGEAAFYGSGLESVEIPASLWTIQPYTFKNCADLTSVTFPEGNLQKISDGAFYGTGLTELVLPDCLSILDVYAFKGCASLTDITIGTGLTELREAVFYGTAIPTITVPEGITKIGPYAFKNCVKLQTIDLPESLTSVGEASFYACTGLKTMELPDAVTTIGNYAFRKCAAITTLTFGSELVTIGECAFYGCTGLTEIVIPNKVTTIKPYAFKTCTGLTAVTLGSKVATIGEGAFNTCSELRPIVFPASLKTIGDYCFSGDYWLWKMTFEGDAPAIGTGAFKGVSATACYPAGNATWTAANMLNYGGKITWKAQ